MQRIDDKNGLALANANMKLKVIQIRVWKSLRLTFETKKMEIVYFFLGVSILNVH